MALTGDLDDPSTKAVEDVLTAVDTHAENGLTAPEAARRLLEYGPNELRSAPGIPAWRRVLSQFQDPLIYLLLLAIAIALPGLRWRR